MSDIEQQATNIIREWTSLTREHAALLALKLNKAGLLNAPTSDEGSGARLETWQRNHEAKNDRSFISKSITSDDLIERIKEYCYENYGMRGEDLEIKSAWEGTYPMGGGLGLDGIYVMWENVPNDFGGHYTQFLDVTVHELMRGDG